MKVCDEHDVGGRLGVALDDFTPRPLPLRAVITRGRAMLIRRRIAAATAAAGAAGAMSVLAMQVGPGMMAATAVAQAQRVKNWPLNLAALPRYHVTVHAPGPGSLPGLIAYGLVGGTAWRVTGTRDTVSRKPDVCITVAMSFWRSWGCQQSLPPLASRHGDPADVSTVSWPQVIAGTVRADVAYLRVILSNGQVLTLQPVAIFGHEYARYVAFAVPFSEAVTQIRAYSRHGELAYAVPFMADGSVATVRWIGAGQPALPRPAAYLIGSGKAGGARWAAKLYVGPWGSCFTLGSDHSCMPADPDRLAQGRVAQVMLVVTRMPTDMIVMATAPLVRYLMIRYAEGSTHEVRVTEAAGVGLAVFSSPRNDKAVSWVALPAVVGKVLGWGQVN